MRVPLADPAQGRTRTSARAASTVHGAGLRSWLADGDEIAVIDVREVGEFQHGHLLAASSLPIGDLEVRIGALVPRRSTRLVVCDGAGDGLADRAAVRLAQCGYTEVHVLAGGAQGWEVDGGALFAKFNVAPKVFGAQVLHQLAVPAIGVEELRQAVDGHGDVLLVDVRPTEEFRRATIPGACNCPGVELLAGVLEHVPSPRTLVVTHCISRTRGMLAAQSLIDAGLENPVAFLDDGAMAWAMAGGPLVRGTSEPLGPPGAAALTDAAGRAQRVAERFGIRRVAGHDLDRLRSEGDRRTLYLLDVRAPAEYEHGHWPGALSAPGGQLVQGIDDWVATRHARVVLADTVDGVRATQTASWLVRMGWSDVFVLAEDPPPAMTEVGPAPVAVPRATPGAGPVTEIDVARLAPALAEGSVTVIDLAKSPTYAAGHIPGAWFAIRSRLAEDVQALAGTHPLVVASPDGVLAGVAVGTAATWTQRPVYVLTGGTRAWVDAGHPLEPGADRLLSPMIDVFDPVWDHGAGPVERFAQYLAWEHRLYDASADAGSLPFTIVT